jgi:murein DD-endopeptidase MepM/ murein hydrolase activator NlpD
MPSRIKRVAIVVYLVIIHAALLYLIGERVVTRYVAVDSLSMQTIPPPVTSTPVPTPIPVPELFADQVPENSNSESAAPFPSSQKFIIPVIGVRPEQLQDNFSDTRSEGRPHNAIDIAAPLGTPVVAAIDGEITKFFDSERGGITIYQRSSDGKFMLYYAHLSRRAEEITIGMKVRQGATIGYVGDTGNAGAGNYHLHFAITRIIDPKRLWDGENIDPYPILRYGEYPQ